MVEPNNSQELVFQVGQDVIRASELRKLIRRNQKGEIFKKLKLIIKYDNADAFYFMLRQGYKIRSINNMRQTAIHMAFYANAAKILQISSIYFKCELDKNFIDRHNLSHLHVACASGNIIAVEHFLKLNEDINVRYNFVEVFHNYDDYAAIQFAIRYEQVKIVELLLSKGASLAPFYFRPYTVFQLACQVTNNFSRQIFLSNSAEDSEEIINASLLVMELLLKNGSRIEEEDYIGNKPLHHVFISNYYEFLDADQYTPSQIRKIVKATRIRQKSKLEFLLEKGADVTAVNKLKQSVLHSAIESLHNNRKPLKNAGNILFDDRLIVEMIDMLLKKGANIDAVDEENQTLIQMAVNVLSADVVKILLEHGVKVDDLQFNYSNFVFSQILQPVLEVVENLLDILELLKKAGYTLSLMNNLNILRLFNINNTYTTFNDLFNTPNNIKYKIENSVSYSTDKGITDCISRLCYHRSELEYFSNKFALNEDFYMSEKVKGIFKALEFAMPSTNKRRSLLKSHAPEIDIMKSTIISDDISIYNILKMNPHSIYQYVENKNYRKILRADDFEEKFGCWGSYIKGHFTKSLIRQYTVDSASQYMKLISKKDLPVRCCRIIFNHLSNEELLNLCCAALNEPVERREKK